MQTFGCIPSIFFQLFGASRHTVLDILQGRLRAVEVFVELAPPLLITLLGGLGSVGVVAPVELSFHTIGVALDVGGEFLRIALGDSAGAVSVSEVLPYARLPPLGSLLGCLDGLLGVAHVSLKIGGGPFAGLRLDGRLAVGIDCGHGGGHNHQGCCETNLESVLHEEISCFKKCISTDVRLPTSALGFETVLGEGSAFSTVDGALSLDEGQTVGLSGVKPDTIRDGLSYTVFVARVPGFQTPWTQPGDFAGDPVELFANLQKAGVRTVVIGMGDGTTRRTSTSTAPDVIRAIFSRDGGEMLREGSF